MGQRYEDLLGTATTVIDMAGSSEQLSQRLQKLSEGVRSAAVTDQQGESSPKANRRKSFLPPQSGSAALDVDASFLHREAIYVLGASLRLIMDAPEYVWKSIEKGKTLQAAWAFMLTRATWLDLTDTKLQSNSQSALAKDGDAGISSVSQAVTLLKVNVKKAFPFIEKQWQTMLPMRKQIVSRAISLLSDAEIESMAVVDQLAALMLIDGCKPDHAQHLLLSQRLTTMQRMVHRCRPKADSQLRNDGSTSKDDRAASMSQTIAQLVILFARTLQHAMQIFALPPKTHPSSSKPLLLDLLSTIIDPSNLASGAPAAASPTAERTLLFPHSAASNGDARQSAAALRALRRRSSHGLPVAEDADAPESAAVADSSTKRSRPLRVSTVGVVEALPSGKILSRLLPSSFWTFAPAVDLESKKTPSQTEDFTDLSTWSAKARESVVGPDSSKSVSLRSLLSELSDVSELASVRRSLRIALRRARRIVSRKLDHEHHAEAVTHVHSELQKFESSIDSILQERLLQLMQQKLQLAVRELLDKTQHSVSDAGVQGESPLDALFAPVDGEASDREGVLEDHVRGRSKQVDELARLYEGPLGRLADDLRMYQGELEADERFDSSESIRAQFDSIVVESREEVERGLNELLDRTQATDTAAGEMSRSTLLVLRIIAVLAEPATGTEVREPLVAALERFWGPQIERRIRTLLSASSTSESPVSDTTLSALATLSESIIHLGPALFGVELARSVHSLLSTLFPDETIAALLAGEDARLHTIRLALPPLLVALKASGRTSRLLIAPSDPPSTTQAVPPLLNLSRRTVDRFTPLPVR